MLRFLEGVLLNVRVLVSSGRALSRVGADVLSYSELLGTCRGITRCLDSLLGLYLRRLVSGSYDCSNLADLAISEYLAEFVL